MLLIMMAWQPRRDLRRFARYPGQAAIKSSECSLYRTQKGIVLEKMQQAYVPGFLGTGGKPCRFVA
jgi:hypothetical protein